VPDPILRPSDVENLAGTDTGRQHLSHTKISMFLACHQKFGHHYDSRLERIDKRESLGMGSAYQKAIEHQRSDWAPLFLDGWTVDDAGNLLPPAEEPYFHTQEAQDRHEINKAIVRAAAALYLRKWPAPVGEQREFEFLVRLRNPWTGHYSRTFDLKGYADGLDFGGWTDLSNSPPSELAKLPLELIENKLSTKVDAIMVQKLPLDRQLQLLRYGVWRATGRPVGTVHFRWMKKPSIRQRQNETVEQFCQRVAEDYEARPDFYAIEPPSSYITSADLLRIECELWLWAEQLRQLRRARLYDRNTSACGDYGGCQYLPLCAGDPDAMSLYRVRPERES
jgi:hypothetical protein